MPFFPISCITFKKLLHMAPVILIPGCAFLSILLIRQPPTLFRPLSIMARYDSLLAIPVIAILSILILRIPGIGGKIATLTWIMSLFAFTLNGLWATGQSDGGALSGLIPWSDNGSYYLGALRLLNAQDILGVATRRPLYPAFFSTLLAISGNNLMVAIALEAGIMSVCVFLAVREMQRTHGAAPAALVLVLFFFYARRHVGTVATECLGISLGAAGFAMLWRSISTHKLPFFLGGLWMMTLGLNVRPGAMLVLPVLLLWAAWFFRGNKHFSTPALGWGALVIAAGFLVNSLFFSTFAAPGSKLNDNFAYILYGIASGGKGWNQYQTDFPECASLSTEQCSNLVLKRAIAEVTYHPENFVRGALKQYPFLISDTYYSLYSFVSYASAAEVDHLWIVRMVNWGLIGLSLAGIFLWTREWDNPYSLLALAFMLGFLISVPFAPPSDANRLRFYAATIVAVMALPALGLYGILKSFRLTSTLILPIKNDLQPTGLVWAAAGLTVCILLLPPLLYGSSLTHSPQSLNCPNGMQPALVEYVPGTYIEISEEQDFFLDWVPHMHDSQFKRNLHSVGAQNIIQPLYQIKPPSTMVSTLNLLNGTGLWVVADTRLLPTQKGLLGMCGQSVKYSNFVFYIPQTIMPVSSQ